MKKTERRIPQFGGSCFVLEIYFERGAGRTACLLRQLADSAKAGEAVRVYARGSIVRPDSYRETFFGSFLCHDKKEHRENSHAHLIILNKLCVITEPLLVARQMVKAHVSSCINLCLFLSIAGQATCNNIAQFLIRTYLSIFTRSTPAPSIFSTPL
jgi:hypothetical protein